MGKKKKQEKVEEVETLYDDIPKKKFHLERKFWIFVFLLFIGAGLAFGGTMFGIMKETKADNREIKETAKKAEIKEDSVKEMTECEETIKPGSYEETTGTIDRNTAIALEEKIDILTYTTDDLFDTKASIFEKNVKNSQISEALKLNSILWYIDVEKEIEVSESEIRRVYAQLNEGKTAPKKINEDEYAAYDYSDINKLFKSVYGYDIKDTKSTIKDPLFAYDSSSKKFIYKDSIEDEDEEEFDDEDYEEDDEEYEGDNYFDYYTYKYEINDKNAYVYLSLAYIDDTNEDYTLVYKDYNKKELYKKITDEEEYDSFEVDRFNYNDFSKYKVTFTKSGSNYVFDNIELIK